MIIIEHDALGALKQYPMAIAPGVISRCQTVSTNGRILAQWREVDPVSLFFSVPLTEAAQEGVDGVEVDQRVVQASRGLPNPHPNCPPAHFIFVRGADPLPVVPTFAPPRALLAGLVRCRGK